jgi:hypothetical protein
VPVPVDSEGILVAHGVKTAAAAAGAYVTPAHQFPLGMAMSLGRRMELLKWAAGAGAFVIEDDYDSEYRFTGRPIPALMSLDRHSNVILIRLAKQRYMFYCGKKAPMSILSSLIKRRQISVRPCNICKTLLPIGSSTWDGPKTLPRCVGHRR